MVQTSSTVNSTFASPGRKLPRVPHFIDLTHRQPLRRATSSGPASSETSHSHLTLVIDSPPQTAPSIFQNTPSTPPISTPILSLYYCIPATTKNIPTPTVTTHNTISTSPPIPTSTLCPYNSAHDTFMHHVHRIRIPTEERNLAQSSFQKQRQDKQQHGRYAYLATAAQQPPTKLLPMQPPMIKTTTTTTTVCAPHQPQTVDDYNSK